MVAHASSRERISRHRAAQRKRGLRPVVLWLPDVNDPGYRERLADECRRLAHLTPEEDAVAADFVGLAKRDDGRRWIPRRSGEVPWWSSACHTTGHVLPSWCGPTCFPN
jgi:hypothetical protein